LKHPKNCTCCEETNKSQKKRLEKQLQKKKKGKEKSLKIDFKRLRDALKASTKSGTTEKDLLLPSGVNKSEVKTKFTTSQENTRADSTSMLNLPASAESMPVDAKQTKRAREESITLAKVSKLKETDNVLTRREERKQQQRQKEKEQTERSPEPSSEEDADIGLLSSTFKKLFRKRR